MGDNNVAIVESVTVVFALELVFPYASTAMNCGQVMEFPEGVGLWALFGSAFVSSTLLPGGSEVLLGYLVQQGEYSRGTLLLVAATGNTLGGMTSWGLGFWLAHRFPAKRGDPKHKKALAYVQRWGSPVLLLSWLPVVGDPLCMAAGWLRINVVTSFLFIALGKTARYAVILWAVESYTG